MSLSNDEEEAMAIFRSIDHNGDGSLELSELGPALSEFGLTEVLSSVAFAAHLLFALAS